MTQRNENILCCVFSVAIVMGGLCLLIYGLAYLESISIKSEDIYARRKLFFKIEVMENKLSTMSISLKNLDNSPLLPNHIHNKKNGNVLIIFDDNP